MSEKNEFRIDPDDLENECVRHPVIMHKYLKKLADAKLALEEAGQVYDLCKVTLDAKIRDRPERYKLTKVTEAAIQNTIRTQKEYLEARDSKVQLQHEVDVLQAAVTALSHKREMLTNLVSLTRMGWYAEPIERGASSEVKQKRRSSGVRGD
jgi:hypothetical protein